MTSDITPFIRKLRARLNVSAEEEESLRGMRMSVQAIERGQVMVRAGDALTAAMLLLSGFAFRTKFNGGGERQIVETNLTGDFVDMHGFILGRLEHEISAASRCDVAIVSHDELQRVTELHPRLTRVFWFQNLVDAAIHREWMLALGRKRSRDRVAQFFCEMQARLEIVGLTGTDGFALPFSQQELADMTGMTPVHLNRSLKELRDAGMVTFRNGRVEIHDPAGLAQAAQFDPAYLHLGPHAI